MTSTRTDVHSPLNLVTEDYRYEGAYYLGSSDYDGYSGVDCPEPGVLKYGGHYGESDDRCDHCGAHISYGAILHHLPTGTHIHVGEICLDNRFSLATAEFQQLRKQAQLDRERQHLFVAWNEYKATHDAPWDALEALQNDFVKDVLGKGRRYGYLSDRQLAAIVRVADGAAKYEAAKAERLANPTPKAPVPEGRVVIEGKIVSAKNVETDFGWVRKILVVVTDANGAEYKVYGNAGSSFNACERGDIIRFTATVTAKEFDFGFFSRPAKGEILEVAA
jgi:hypothetical protein